MIYFSQISFFFCVEAVRQRHPRTEDQRVEKAVTAFFIGARDRCGGTRKRSVGIASSRSPELVAKPHGGDHPETPTLSCPEIPEITQ